MFFKRENLNNIIIGVLFFSVLFLAFKFYMSQRYLEGSFKRLLDSHYSSCETMKVSTQEYPMDLVSTDSNDVLLHENDCKKTASWLEVQKLAKDTVVQVVSQIARFNFLEPYKTPEQGACGGTGFFINEKGHILTNYHVIDEATVVHIKIPHFGQETFETEVIGVSPDRDIALLKLKDKDFEAIKEGLGGKIRYLPLGNSDKVLRTQKLLVLGYPLSLPTLKSTQGIVSGRERIGNQSYLQITAPINPGNSGGPALNSSGEVIGIANAGIPSAQNMGYIIPISEIKSSINDLYKVKFLRKPLLGAWFASSTKELANYLKNPGDGGWHVVQVFENSILEKNGIKTGDMIYEINGYRVDRFGEVTVPWSEDKIPVLSVLNRLVVGDKIKLLIYRNGKSRFVEFKLEQQHIMPIRVMYPLFEKIDYEVFGGMVVMELSLNHVALLMEVASHLMNYTKAELQCKPRLIVTHILLNSQASKTLTLGIGSVISQVNGVDVTTLADYRKAILKSKKLGHLTIKFFDGNIDDLFISLPLDKVLEDEDVLSARYFYKKSPLIEQLKK